MNALCVMANQCIKHNGQHSGRAGIDDEPDLAGKIGPFAYPGQQGYSYVFGLMAVLAVIGFIVASALTRMIRKPEEAIPAVA